MNYYDLYEVKTWPENVLTFYAEDNATAKGGFASGIGAFAGFSIYPHKNISIGAEFSYALLYYEIGGEFQGTAVKQEIPNPPKTEVYSNSSTSYKGTQFSKVIPSLNIGVAF